MQASSQPTALPAARAPQPLQAAASARRLQQQQLSFWTPSSRCRSYAGLRRAQLVRALLRAPTAAAAAATSPQPLLLLDWLVEWQGAAPACLKVERRLLDEGMGWSLVATADIEPEEVILSVPLTAAITSEGADESRWSAHMAALLLERQAQSAAAAAGSPALARSIQPWLDALPAHVDLPWLFWSDAELAELQDEDTLGEAEHMRGAYEQACQELGGRFSEQQVAWALSLAHSRSFVQQGVHVWVPGIDLCNHTLTPNADIRCIHSPGSCQGAAALDEVCPPSTAAAAAGEPSRFELVAGEGGIAAGEEVCISYGGWPSDVFLLFFGFAPADNPNDSGVLFYDLLHLATFQQRLAPAAAAPPGDPEEVDWEQAEAVVRELEAQIGSAQEFVRMVATASGIDSRLLQAAEALLAAGRHGGRPMSLPEFLVDRCRQLLSGYPMSLEEDEALLRQLAAEQVAEATGAAAGAAAAGAAEVQRRERLRTAVVYRLGKKRILHATLSAMQQQ